MILFLRGGRADPFEPRIRPEAKETQEQPTLQGRLIESHAGARVHAMRGQPGFWGTTEQETGVSTACWVANVLLSAKKGRLRLNGHVVVRKSPLQ
jgi:hypothetical protein